MPRHPSIIRPTKLHLGLPEDVRTRLDLFLFSELEGCVPRGAYQRFVIDRVHEFFNNKNLSLEPFGFPAGFYVSGPAAMVEALATRLKEPR